MGEGVQVRGLDSRGPAVKIADLVEHDGRRWFAQRRDRDARVMLLVAWDGSRKEVADDLDTTDPGVCRVVCNPAKDWPFVITRMSTGAIIRVEHPHAHRMLDPFVDWCPTMPGASSGAIFLGPTAGVTVGDILLVHREGPKIERVNVPSTFATVAQRSRRRPLPPEPRTAYSHLLEDDGDDKEK